VRQKGAIERARVRESSPVVRPPHIPNSPPPYPLRCSPLALTDPVSPSASAAARMSAGDRGISRGRLVEWLRRISGVVVDVPASVAASAVALADACLVRGRGRGRDLPGVAAAAAATTTGADGQASTDRYMQERLSLQLLYLTCMGVQCARFADGVGAGRAAEAEAQAVGRGSSRALVAQQQDDAEAPVPSASPAAAPAASRLVLDDPFAARPSSLLGVASVLHFSSRAVQDKLRSTMGASTYTRSEHNAMLAYVTECVAPAGDGAPPLTTLEAAADEVASVTPHAFARAALDLLPPAWRTDAFPFADAALWSCMEDGEARWSPPTVGVAAAIVGLAASGHWGGEGDGDGDGGGASARACSAWLSLLLGRGGVEETEEEGGVPGSRDSPSPWSRPVAPALLLDPTSLRDCAYTAARRMTALTHAERETVLALFRLPARVGDVPSLLGVLGASERRGEGGGGDGRRWRTTSPRSPRGPNLALLAYEWYLTGLLGPHPMLDPDGTSSDVVRHVLAAGRGHGGEDGEDGEGEEGRDDDDDDGAPVDSSSLHLQRQSLRKILLVEDGMMAVVPSTPAPPAPAVVPAAAAVLSIRLPLSPTSSRIRLRPAAPVASSGTTPALAQLLLSPERPVPAPSPAAAASGPPPHPSATTSTTPHSAPAGGGRMTVGRAVPQAMFAAPSPAPAGRLKRSASDVVGAGKASGAHRAPVVVAAAAAGEGAREGGGDRRSSSSPPSSRRRHTSRSPTAGSGAGLSAFITSPVPGGAMPLDENNNDDGGGEEEDRRAAAAAGWGADVAPGGPRKGKARPRPPVHPDARSLLLLRTRSSSTAHASSASGGGLAARGRGGGGGGGGVGGGRGTTRDRTDGGGEGDEADEADEDGEERMKVGV
jgi:hypothetical protein